MSFAYVRPIAKHGDFYFVEFIAMSPDDTVPGRPQPQPPLGIWGPTDPRPTLPIAGWNPGTGTWPGATGPSGPTGPGLPEGSKVAVLSPVPEGQTPPAAPPADASVHMINLGPGTTPTYAWVAPYAATTPPVA